MKSYHVVKMVDDTYTTMSTVQKKDGVEEDYGSFKEVRANWWISVLKRKPDILEPVKVYKWSEKTKKEKIKELRRKKRYV